jgi:RHS repeat-associated protein
MFSQSVQFLAPTSGSQSLNQSPNRLFHVLNGYSDGFTWTGRWHDWMTGLQYNDNRWYNSETGRWMSEDPIGFAAGDANLYRYVGNMPTTLNDPNGLYNEVPGYPYPGWPFPPQPQPPPGRRLTNPEKAALAPYIPKEDLDNARVHCGEMPWYAPDWAAGITRGNDIYVRDPDSTFETPDELGFLGHELEHVRQYREGMTWYKYLWRSWHGYDENPYEKEAEKKEEEIKNKLRAQ